MGTLDDVDFEEEPWQFEMTFAQHATNTKKHRFETKNWRELMDTVYIFFVHVFNIFAS